MLQVCGGLRVYCIAITQVRACYKGSLSRATYMIVVYNLGEKGSSSTFCSKDHALQQYACVQATLCWEVLHHQYYVLCTPALKAIMTRHSWREREIITSFPAISRALLTQMFGGSFLGTHQGSAPRLLCHPTTWMILYHLLKQKLAYSQIAEGACHVSPTRQ